MLDNIIENSVKYKKGSGCNVDMVLSFDDGFAILTVSDDGKGIKEEDLPYIFDNLYRGGSEKTGVSGSGIGLWLVKKIVEDHGGSVFAKSEYQKGTSIVIRLKEDSRQRGA